MSFETSVSRLPSHIRDLVFSVSKNGEELLGNDEADKQEVCGWIEKTSQGALATENNLKVCNNATMETPFKTFIQDLDTLLVPRTYIAANYITAADVALYGTLRPIMVLHLFVRYPVYLTASNQAKLQPSEYHAIPAVTRYFNHIQSLPVVQSSAVILGDFFKPVPLDLDNVPKSERKFDSLKKKEKPAKETAVAREPETKAMLESSDPTSAPGERKQKKGKEVTTQTASSSSTIAGNTKKGGKTPAEDEGEPLPYMIDLRVGHIVDSEWGHVCMCIHSDSTFVTLQL